MIEIGWFNVIGLSFDIIGALLLVLDLFIFNPKNSFTNIEPETQDKKADYENSETVKHAKRQRTLSICGFILLIVGFILQIIGNWPR